MSIKLLIALMLAGGSAVGQQYYNPTNAIRGQTFNYGGFIINFSGANTNYHKIANLIVEPDYNGTIQLGTNYWRVVSETNVETTYHVKQSDIDGNITQFGPGGIGWHAGKYTSTTTTNITMKLEEIK